METKKKLGARDFLPILIMAGLFIVIHGLALLISSTFAAAEMQVWEDKNDPFNIVQILVIILVMTVLILLIAKYWKERVIQLIILFAVGYTTFFILLPLLGLVFVDWLALALAISIAFILVLTLFKYPEWYVIDICGIVVGAGAIALFGISLSIFLVLCLLIALMIYDAISVYKTKHMIDLADTVMDLKLPVLLVVPKIRGYSLLKQTKRLKEKLKDEEERDAFFMGLGDVVMPGILVVATYFNIENGLPVAISTILGTLVGFAVLMTFVIKGKPQAGLPTLCGGAILGYLISSYVLFGSIVGLNLPSF